MSELRNDWLNATVSKSQILIGALTHADFDHARTAVHDFARRLQTPPDRAHGIVLACLLLNLSARITEQLHRNIAGEQPCQCARVTQSTARQLATWTQPQPKQIFDDWATDFFVAYSRHWSSPEDRAASLIRAAPLKAWTLAEVSNQVGHPERRVARAFAQRYGTTIRTYAHIARMHRLLLGGVGDTKIDVVAAEAGYRSKKDFYRALAQVLQLTPTELRRLTPAQRAAVRGELEVRLITGPDRTEGQQRSS